MTFSVKIIFISVLPLFVTVMCPIVTAFGTNRQWIKIGIKGYNWRKIILTLWCLIDKDLDEVVHLFFYKLVLFLLIYTLLIFESRSWVGKMFGSVTNTKGWTELKNVLEVLRWILSHVESIVRDTTPGLHLCPCPCVGVRVLVIGGQYRSGGSGGTRV